MNYLLQDRSAMPPIEDYAFIGDTHSAALVSRSGSIDWLCLPRFDSGACFSALLDEERGGRWSISPKSTSSTSRAYRTDSMVLETTFETTEGAVLLVDCLALEEASDVENPRSVQPDEMVVRTVRGIRGKVPMLMEFSPRFDYGYVVPFFDQTDPGRILAVGGPDAFNLSTDVPLRVEDGRVLSEFEIGAGETLRFLAAYYPSHLEPQKTDLEETGKLIEQTDSFWRRWAQRCSYQGRWREEVKRSLLVLKALTYSPTGGLVAAPTTSLPEHVGGVRNWDYRYCWLRDATLTLDGLTEHGYLIEAEEWMDWLLRAVAGDPEDFQIMYGVNGERRLPEYELDWLPGYQGSRPVRVGNAAVGQFQLDVFGEVMDSFHSARRAGLHVTAKAWELQKRMVEFVGDHWQDPDEGIWEVRSGPRHFVQSKVMAWVAVDRGVKAIEEFGRQGPVRTWKQLRRQIRSDIFDRGYHPQLGHFVRSYGERVLDASLLRLPLVGFIDAKDPRMQRTIDAIKTELSVDGLLMRYRTSAAEDGLPPGEGAFLLCSFWLADCLSLAGRHDEAEEIFERLLGLCNDVGLLSEEYDTRHGRMLGNFPQAFSHVGLVTTAAGLESKGRAMSLHRGT